MRARVCFVILLLASACLLQAGAGWRAGRWMGERAWIADDEGWRAVVSESRGRLVYFGPESGRANMLYSARSATVPSPQDPVPRSWGGHRLWLGPQTAWEPVWPPPSGWEFSPAQVRLQGGWLKLTLPEPGGIFPAITRLYRWENGALRCDVRWRDSRRAWCAMHIFAIPAAAQVEATVTPSAEWPRGFVLLPIYKRWDIRTKFSLPVTGLKLTGDRVQFSYGEGMQKIGLPAGTLRWSIGTRAVTLTRSTRPEKGRAPDAGAFTQVYIGNPALKEGFFEIEQLSTLRAPSPFSQQFSVYLHPEITQP